MVLQIKKWCCALAVVMVFVSCGSDDNSVAPDTYNYGTIHISADESFKPVIDSEIQVYESIHPKTHIIPHYKPEAECLKDFGVDSIRMVIATRTFTTKEEQFMLDSMNVDPFSVRVAFDAIAVIVNPQSADSMFTMNEIRDLVTGKSSRKLTPVFDGVQATSTVRFMIDSVLKGQSLGANVVAAQNSAGVIDYVAKTKNAVGFIGVSWIGNKEDSTQLTFLQKVKLAYVESTDNPGGYVQPVQANIYYKRYPMIRDLTYTLKETHRGLGHAFGNFLSNEQGQLIFKRAYLMPAQMQFNVRQAKISE